MTLLDPLKRCTTLVVAAGDVEAVAAHMLEKYALASVR
jgi:hypothetical protein